MPVKKTDDSAEIHACHHMRHSVEALAGNSLKGPVKWYTALHCSYCSHCGTALKTHRHAREAERKTEVAPS